jgi:hypothetical protein
MRNTIVKIYEQGRRLLAVGLLGAVLAACGATGATQGPQVTAAPAPTQAPQLAVEPTARPAATAAPVQVPQPTQAPQPTVTQPIPTPEFAAPSADTRAAADALLAKLRQAHAGAPVLVGITGVEGDYASALALPFGERPQYAFLKRAGAAWEVVFASSIVSGEVLGQAGVPASLTQTSDTSAIVDAWLSQLQDARGTGVEGDVEVEGIAGDYARVSFRPADPMVRDGFTAFLKRENGDWQQITGGTAFDTEALKQLGIPQELWAWPEA